MANTPNIAERMADLKEALELRGHKVESVEAASKGRMIAHFGDGETAEKDGLNKKKWGTQ